MSINSSTETPNNPQSRRKRVVINLQKSSRKSRQNIEQSQESTFNPSKQLPKLLEISERCFHYYQKFKEDRLEEDQFAGEVFQALLAHLQGEFQEIRREVGRKEKELRDCVLQKKKQILSFYPTHFLSLTQKIQQIKSQKSHFQSLLPLPIPLFPQSSTTFSLNFNSSSQTIQPKQPQITEFAKILNDFYIEVQIIQKSNYRQHIVQSTKFLKNLIDDQCAVFCKKFLCQSTTPHENISFNNQVIFGVGEFCQGQGQGLGSRQGITNGNWEEFKLLTERMQRERDEKIQEYALRAKVF